uniref:Phosphatidylinositol-3-phosphatase SAC1 n=1 Tax=Steinernema glaseri TaxID=37863 RepID=A0A1I7Z0G1_9BILA
MQYDIYGGKHVIVNLVNQKGREKRIGGELERTIVQANLDYVRYNGFDFHKECHAMNWDRLSVLQEQLSHEINTFGFFLSSLNNPEQNRVQTGYFRTNCMDCLDRTNVVQAMIAKESLLQQLIFMDIAPMGSSVEQFTEFNSLFKNLWADNGDECSKQYAGTGALKADFTRVGKRTYGGALNDGVNALTRYFKNNFYDGYRQDAIDLFLGNFRVDPNNLPDSLEQSVINFDFHGVAILFAVFAAAMVVLCLIVAAAEIDGENGFLASPPEARSLAAARNDRFPKHSVYPLRQTPRGFSRHGALNVRVIGDRTPIALPAGRRSAEGHRVSTRAFGEG